MERSRVVEVLSPGRRGSAVLIAPRLVLTAAHVVPDGPGAAVRVRPVGSAAVDAVVVWRRYDGPGRGVDAALVELAGPGRLPADLSPLHLGQVRGEEPGLAVQVLGFPEAMARNGLRDLDQVAGVVNPLAGRLSGRLQMTVESWPERRDGLSLWAGVSGGPVTGRAVAGAGDVLLGVVVVAPEEIRSRLTVVPVAAVLDDGRARQIMLDHGVELELVPLGALPDDAPAAVDCPYPGLLAFAEADAGWFRGRRRATDQLVARAAIQAARGGPLVVIGPSGVGKSSLLRAGLMTAWERGDVPLERGPGGPAVYLRGARPIAEAAATLASAVGADAAAVAAAVRDGPQSLAAVLQGARADDGTAGGPVLVIVDQLEEIFAADDVAGQGRATLTALIEAGRPGPERAVLLVLGVRIDFFDRCARFAPLRPYLQDNQFLVDPLTPGELREAVVEPAAAVGLVVEDGLVEVLLAEAGTDSLPQLAHALRQTFGLRRGRTLTVAGYRATGGIAQAVATTADAVHDSLDEAGRLVLRHLMLSLVAIGENVEDTRRRVHRRDLPAGAGAGDAELDHLLPLLISQRLVTADRDSYLLSHEALIQAWPRLQAWLQEDRDWLRVHRELSARARTWARFAHDPKSLYGGAEFAVLRDRAEAHLDDLDALEREFYLACRDADAGDRAAEEAAVRARIRRTRVLYAVSAVLSLLLAVAVTATQLALRARGQAEQARRLSLSRQLATASEATLASRPDVASLLAVEAYRVRPDGEPTSEAARSLTAAAARPLTRTLRGARNDVVQVSFSRDGTVVAALDQDGAARWWDVRSGRLVRAVLPGGPGHLVTSVLSADGSLLAAVDDDSGRLRLWDARTDGAPEELAASGVRWCLGFDATGTLLACAGRDAVQLWDTRSGRARPALAMDPGTDVTGGRFAPDGSVLATSGQDGRIRLWNTRTGAAGQVLTGPGPGPDGRPPVGDLAFGPDGRTLAAFGPGGTTRLWDTATGRAGPVLEDGTEILAVAFSPDGRRVATGGSGGTATLWDARTGERAADLRGHDAEVAAFAFSPDGRTLATAGYDFTARLWDVATGDLITTLTGHASPVGVVAFSPDGASLATGGGDNRQEARGGDNAVRVWDVRRQLLLHHSGGTVRGAGVSPDGALVATGGEDGTARLWNARTGSPVRVLAGHRGAVDDVAFSPDGALVATGGADGTARLWNARTGAPVRVLAGHRGAVDDVAFSPDGALVATGSADGPARLWDARTGSEVHVLPGSPGTVFAGVPEVAFSPDGSLLAASGKDGTTRLWNTGTGVLTASLRGEDGGSSALAFSGDGRRLATAGGMTLQVWDVRSGTVTAVMTGHTGSLYSVAFSPDGSIVASGSDDDTARLWDSRTGGQLAVLTGHTLGVGGVAFSPDGTMLATAAQNWNGILWDVRTRHPLATLEGAAYPLAFSPDGSFLVTSGVDSTALIWRTPPRAERSAELICTAVGRNLTDEEWTEFLPEQPRHATCPSAG